jgi:AraC family transcriptional regulator, regulatory protein of adaptative response / DNA-3-methyladenine glycosylase II
VALDSDTCFVAMASRDRRFEGRFFVAVRTTKIYCRPGCPAPIPLRKNVTFFQCAAAAEEAGYRPCSKCRPDASPDTSAWLGTSATVRRALRLIADEGLGDEGVDALAERLGMGSRHLRRLFSAHVGASPLAVANTRRLHFARRLLDETRLPVSEVAFASGFASVRRFNDAVRLTYRKTPTELRRKSPSPTPIAEEHQSLSLRVPFSPPYDFEGLLRFLRARAVPGVESVSTLAYRRTFAAAAGSGILEVRLGQSEKDRRSSSKGAGWLELSLWGAPSHELFTIVERVRRVFDVAVDPRAIGSHLAKDASLRPLVRARPGLRVAGAWDGFEIAVRAVLGQQISVASATTLAGRLAARFGRPLPELDRACASDTSLTRLFPTAEVLADARVEVIGLPGARASAVRALASAVAEGKLTLGPGADVEKSHETLLEIPGVGPWTASYVAMRALREPDAFPASDLVLRRAIVPGRTLSANEVDRRAEVWRPWRAYAAMHLWAESSQQKSS